MTPIHSISVIVPALNEAETIGPTLTRAAEDENVDLIVVDGGSSDQTKEVADAHGARMLSNTEGRAAQMNTGADTAEGEILLFLHADTVLPRDYGRHVRDIIEGEPHTLGAFPLRINSHRTAFRWVERMVQWRSRWFHMPYGDQALFLQKSWFQELGGFPDIPIMEDYAFVLKARKKGHIAQAPVPVVTSARRWSRLGVTRTTLINQCMLIGYHLGTDPSKLAAFYRQKRESYR